MLKAYIKGSNIIELVSEDTNEDSSMYKAVLRVVGKTEDWSSMIVKLLMAPDEDSDYLTSVRKEYYISDENKPTFCWVLVVWGDVFEAFAEIGPIIQSATSSAKPTPPKRKVAAAPQPSTNSIITRKTFKTEDGMRVVSSVPLAFKRGRRDDPGTTKTLGKRKGVGAFVSNVTGNGGL